MSQWLDSWCCCSLGWCRLLPTPHPSSDTLPTLLFLFPQHGKLCFHSILWAVCMQAQEQVGRGDASGKTQQLSPHFSGSPQQLQLHVPQGKSRPFPAMAPWCSRKGPTLHGVSSWLGEASQRGQDPPHPNSPLLCIPNRCPNTLLPSPALPAEHTSSMPAAGRSHRPRADTTAPARTNVVPACCPQGPAGL